MKIVPYNDKYRTDVSYVCACTGPPQALTDSRMNAYILNMFCNYYIDNEQENVFVLTDDNDRAVGYILSTPSYKRFRKGIKKYLLLVRKTGIVNVIEGYSELLCTGAFSKKYPAHLHIDILDEYTGSGYGSQLMETLLGHLRSLNVSGVMLIVSSGNKGAVNFYKRKGFKTLLKTPPATVMGLKL